MTKQSSSDRTQFRTEVLHGAENAVGRGIEFMANTKKRMDLYYDSRAPSIVIEVPEYRNGYLDVKKRGGAIRVITDITKENLRYCKELMEFVELRHLAEVKGGLAVNESEYMATTVLEEAKPLTQVIYSNVPEVVAQGQHIFDTFWDLAVPAEQRVWELETGSFKTSTKIIDDPEKVDRQFSSLIESSHSLRMISSVSAMRSISNAMFEEFRESAKRHPADKDGESGIRWITTMDRESTEYVRRFLSIGVQVRHVGSLPALSFAIGDGKLFAAVESAEDEKVSRSVLISDEQAYLEHFGRIFERAWEEGQNAEDRIQEIESGEDRAGIELIRNHRESIARAWDAVASAKHEVFILFSTPGALRRQLEMGAAKILKRALSNGSRIRILVPLGPGLGIYANELDRTLEGMQVRFINERLRTNMTIVIVDNKECFNFELKDDTKHSSYEAIGIAIYSNSRTLVSSYGAILETLWSETELYRQLEAHDKMQREFINIATHELRTPIQPILGLSEILASRAEAGSEDRELLNAIWRSAKRLNKLAEAILDVTKIESRALNLQCEVFDLNELIASAVSDLVSSPAVGNSADAVNISVIYADRKAYVLGDRDRLLQVISNLLANAVKFTVQGSVTVLVRIEDVQNDDVLAGDGAGKFVTVRIKDSGPGIDPLVFPRLFTKFATGSTWGTGLGLYVSKGIVQAHHGKIAAKNNEDGKGATFAFSIPYHPSSTRR